MTEGRRTANELREAINILLRDVVYAEGHSILTKPIRDCTTGSYSFSTWGKAKTKSWSKY